MFNGAYGIARAARHAHLPPAHRPITPRLSPLPRRTLQTQQFSPFTPPDPAKLGPPRIRNPRKPRKGLRRLLLISVIGLPTAYFLDTRFNASALTRSARTFWTGILIGVDYKINFRPNPPLADSIEDLHARNAQRIFDLLRENGGLYLKIGQAIAMQSAILPPAFQKMFARMFDDAPQNDWVDVQRVIREDFGVTPEELIGDVIEHTARASASVAQVHWARLPDGREVAVKIQKREIAAQVGWDLWAFKVVARVYSWWFDLPMYTLVPYISERLMLETDFEVEADNAEEMARLVAGEPRLRGRVYIPKVYRELSSRRVMTSEWIEGVRLWDKDGITGQWQGGWRAGSPGAGGTPLPEKDLQERSPHTDLEKSHLKPDRGSWQGRDGKGGLGVSLKAVMTTMVDLFSAQMFLWGVVHCDPHPGNIFIRRLPGGAPELVLIDHGLYIRMAPGFRHQYAAFWKALIGFDNKAIADIVHSWGINNPDIFASVTLMRPYTGGANKRDPEEEKRWKAMSENERAYETQVAMRAGVRQILGDEDKWPRELIFIGRNLRIVQGNNAFLGSPVNRIKITGMWASRALAESRDLRAWDRVRNWWGHWAFRLVLLGSDVVWWWARVKQVLGLGGGMEQEIEERMRVMAKGFGVELNHGLFEG
ncbi:ABC1-domain-containing protein [Trichodelitschia bisporula]|uniref:ABC1-domain-containing protein n=1 Tax=Trichodelitschia bisporula TaxID=703511 RepID=A0A6G1IA47_9PEZI|nr:ABC1-domain-containing protein [Trichodelitschia bisporula]